MKPSVSLCMIVRNEQYNLPACVRGVRRLVDEFIVVDTGSTDQTPTVAAEWGGRVFNFPWADDFATARNESRRHARGDWIFWLDADDRIDQANVRRLEMLFAQLAAASEPAPVGFLMACRSQLPATRGLGCEVSHLRLFPREAPIAWTGRVHERLELLDQRRLLLRWSDVVIQHTGYEDPVQRRRKLQRNLRILQLDFASRPDDATTLFHLGWCHLELDNLAESLRFLKRSLRCENRAGVPLVRKAYALIVDCLSRLRRKSEALELCQNALRRYPQDTELLFFQGQLLGELNDLPGAECCFLQLLTTPADSPFQYGVELGLRGAKSHYMLGLLYEQQGRVWEAELQYRAALAERPGYAFAWVGLGQLYLALGRNADFAAVLERLAACPGGELMAPTLYARQCIIERRFDEGRALLDQVLARDPEFLWPRMVLSDLLFVSGVDRRLCVQVHRQILQSLPDQPGLRARLKWLLAQPAEATPPADNAHGPFPVAYQQETFVTA